MTRPCALGLALLLATTASANPPVASYIFPAGGQRGTKVAVRVGGLFLHESCGFEMRGPGVQAPAQLQRTRTLWFEGPLLPLPQSQQAEDYPKDMAGEIQIAPDAPLGARYWRLTTSQGATPARTFVVGDLPEVIEDEIDGDPVPVSVTLPVTINGRIFPREDIDLWSFRARKGEAITCEVHAARLGSPLDARLEMLDAQGRVLAENDDNHGSDPVVYFTAPANGVYQVRIRDTRAEGGQAFVYRLTLTTGPHITHFFPLGGRRGETIALDLTGHGLPATSTTVPLHDSSFSARIAGQPANPILLDLDDLPEHRDPSKSVTLPAIFNGRIDKPGKVDTWSWTATKGDTIEFELRAALLESRLDGVLTVCDSAGKILATADTPAPGRRDPVLRFTAPADGTYLIQVRERFASRGGPGFAYRLRATRPQPDFRLALQSDAVTVPRGGQGKLKMSVERLGGLKEPITLTVRGLPDGVTVSPLTIPPGGTALDLTFKADAQAAIRPAHVVIEGSVKLGSSVLTHAAVLRGARDIPPLDDVLLAVALPTPFKIKGEYDMGFAARGSVLKRRYTIEREGYDGPIEVSLADRQARHLQGVTGSTIVVPAGANEFTYEVTLPPWMETGRTSRTCVMGVATIADGGVKHRVSFSSVNQNEQLVAVVGPGRLTVASERSALVARPGTLPVPVLLRRGEGVQGEVRVELAVPAHIRGVSADPLLIPAGQERGILQVRFAAPPAGPFNMPLVLRATLQGPGPLTFGETRIEVLPER